jgi:hypothetical protein
MLAHSVYQLILHVLSDANEPIPHRVVRMLVSRSIGRHINSEEYFEQIEELSSRGLVERSRGAGGIISLRNPNAVSALSESVWTEPALMPRLREYLEKRFWKEIDIQPTDPGSDWFVVNTAMTGSREGQWTQPDFTAISITPFKVLPSAALDVYTFELKCSAAGGVQAVHQSLHQTKFSNYGYVVWPPETRIKVQNEIENACYRTGIGLILIDDPLTIDSWKIRIEPERKQPSEVEVDVFLSTSRFTADQRERIRKKLSRV